MAINIGPAAAALGGTARIAGPKPALRPPGGEDFAGLVRNAAAAAVDSLKRSEDASLKAIAGKADINEVVTAIANAELTLQAVVAVRDKVVAAYLDIIRMPI
ncbi:MAG: flagellar hook-basal body complex protein FliE [Pseudomonadota bacterium]